MYVNLLMNTHGKYLIHIEKDKMLQTSVFSEKETLVQLCLY